MSVVNLLERLYDDLLSKVGPPSIYLLVQEFLANLSLKKLGDFIPDQLDLDIILDRGLVGLPPFGQKYIIDRGDTYIKNYSNKVSLYCREGEFVLLENLCYKEEKPEVLIENVITDFTKNVTNNFIDLQEDDDFEIAEEVPRTTDTSTKTVVSNNFGQNVFQEAIQSELQKMNLEENFAILNDLDYRQYDSWQLLSEKLTKNEIDSINFVLETTGLTTRDFESMNSGYGIFFLKLIGALSKDWIVFNEVYTNVYGHPYSIAKWQLEFLRKIAIIISKHIVEIDDYYDSLIEIERLGNIFRLGTGTGKTFAILTIAILFAYNPYRRKITSGQQGKVIIIQPKNLLTNEFGVSLNSLLSTRCGLLLVYDERIPKENLPKDLENLYITKLSANDLNSVYKAYENLDFQNDMEEEDLDEVQGLTNNAKLAISEAKTRVNVAAYSKTLTPLNHTFLISTPEKALNLLGNSYLKLSDDRSNKSLGDMIRCVLIDEGHLIVDSNRGFGLDEIAVYLRILEKPFFIFSGTINDPIVNSLSKIFGMKVYEISNANKPSSVGRFPVIVRTLPYTRDWTPNQLVLNATKTIYGLDGATINLPTKSIISKKTGLLEKYPGFVGLVAKHCVLRLLFGKDSPIHYFDNNQILKESLSKGYKHLLNDYRCLIFYQSKLGLEALYAYLVVFSYYVSPDVQRIFEDDSLSTMNITEFPFTISILPNDLEKLINSCETYVFEELSKYDKSLLEDRQKVTKRLSELLSNSDDLNKTVNAKRLTWYGFRLGYLFYHASMQDNVMTHDANMVMLSSCISGFRNAAFPCNLIVCTSVIQEGVNPSPLSMLMCHPWSYSKLILEEWRQIRGRLGRQKPGEVILTFTYKEDLLKYSNFNSDVVLKQFPDNLFYRRYFFAYQYLYDIKDLDVTKNELSMIINKFSVAGLFKPITLLNSENITETRDIMEEYKAAQMNILSNLPKDLQNFLDIVFDSSINIPILDVGFLMYTVYLCAERSSEDENFGGTILACCICLTFLKDKVKARDYEESITNNKTLSSIISKTYHKMYSIDLPREFSGEIVRFSKRLYSILSGHANLFEDNYMAVPYEFLEAIFPTLKMMAKVVSPLTSQFLSLEKAAQQYASTYDAISVALQRLVSIIEKNTSQRGNVYTLLTKSPKSLGDKTIFEVDFIKKPEYIAQDTQGVRAEVYVYGLLNVDVKSQITYGTVRKLISRIKALLNS